MRSLLCTLALALASVPVAAQRIPSGTLTPHSFETHVAKDLPNDEERYIVYTPPNYDPHKPGGYPVLYLLHGFLGHEDGWTLRGHADQVLDRDIAEGKAVPMIVVMPLGYGDWNFLQAGLSIWRDPEAVRHNRDLYVQMFESEIMPRVEAEYNIAKGRENHAIAGLSMGGLETLAIGLNHPEQFAWVCGFSSAVKDFNAFPAEPPASGYSLLWVSVGTSDQLLTANRELVGKLKADGYSVNAVETAGAHEWPVWRNNFESVAPLLFQPAASKTAPSGPTAR